MKKLILSCFLSALCLTSVYAVDDSGTCGENLNWSYDSSTKTLSITGQGDMSNYKVLSYSTGYTTPWWNYHKQIENISIANGVTSIGVYAFADCEKVANIILPNSVKKIGESAFYGCSALTTVYVGEDFSDLGDKAFYGCSALTSFTCAAYFPPTVRKAIHTGNTTDAIYKECWAFANTNQNLIIYVPCARLEVYENSDWSQLYTTLIWINNHGGMYEGYYEAELRGFGNCEEPPVPRTYTVTVLSSDISKGTVSGGGQYEEGTTVTITATPKEGYDFIFWSDESEQNPYSFIVTEDVTITAYFGVDYSSTYVVIVQSADSLMGTASFSNLSGTQNLNYGQYTIGTNLIAKANPNQGYKFSHWNDGISANPRGITVESNIILRAYFESENTTQPMTYTVSVSSANTSMGTVSGGGTYEEGQTATITATPKSGYKFTRWSNGSTANPYSFTVTSDISLTAYFEQIPASQSESKFWNISDAAFNSLGTITSQTTINGLTIHATANKPIVVDADAREINGYSFTHRLKFGGTGASNARMLSFRVDGNCDIDIYLMSASGSADRTLNVDKGSFGSTLQQIPAYGSSISRGNVHYVGGATTIYLYSPSSGINIYAIQVSYGSTPTPTEPIMVTCAEAAQIASSLSHNTQTSETYIVTGYITETDGVVSRGQQVFWMADTQNGGKVFESYWGNVTEKMLVGDKVSVEGKIMRYNSIYEIK
ncbi:MAG: leucine-rich repeat protein, partial [Paludibacteraceae bacterium]|nr:leucine-rich repeat protein [Paludibacteraceae bacterium]